MENFILANCTDTGKVRGVNEDSMVTFDSPNGRVLAVCDGMGGQNAGDVASQLAVTVIKDILTDNTFASPEEAITRSIMAANQAILRRAAQDVNLGGMGATCVMVIIKDGLAYYGSVGDSRIYYIAGGTIRQVTKDQSYVQTLVDAGEITQEAAEHHHDKNQITNALGLEGMMPPVVSQMPITPEPGAVMLLCSDGLSGMINNNTILATVSNHQMPLASRAQQLVDQANAAGGLDNITVQLVEFGEAGGTQAYGRNNGTKAEYSIPVSARNKSKMGYYVIAACLLALAIGGGVYWFLTQKENSPILPKTEVVKKDTKTKDVAKKKEVVKEKIVVEETKEVKKLDRDEQVIVKKSKERQQKKQQKKQQNKEEKSITGDDKGNGVIKYENLTGEKN